VNAEALPAGQLACLLYDAAEGMCADVAAVMLIDRHGHFLHEPAFRRIIAAGSSITTGQPLAVIRWKAAICALEAGQLPCSGSEQAILRIAASLADPASPSISGTTSATSMPATSPWSPTPSRPPTADPAPPQRERHPRSLSVKPLRKIEGGFAGGTRRLPRRRGCGS